MMTDLAVINNTNVMRCHADPPIVGFLYAHKPSAGLGNVQFVQRS